MAELLLQELLLAELMLELMLLELLLVQLLHCWGCYKSRCCCCLQKICTYSCTVNAITIRSDNGFNIDRSIGIVLL